MATLESRLSDVVARIATESKALRTLLNGNVGDLSALATTNKTTMVIALNELKGLIDNVQAGVVDIIDDAASTGSDVTYSIDKIKVLIQAAKDELLGGAPSAALDTIAELAAALTSEGDAVAAITTALTFRVRFDAAQTLDATQKAQACSNIGIGDPDTNLVDIFNAALV